MEDFGARGMDVVCPEPHPAPGPCQQDRAGRTRQGGELVGDGGLTEAQ